MRAFTTIILCFGVTSSAFAQDVDEDPPVDSFTACLLLEGHERSEDEQSEWETLNCNELLGDYIEEQVAHSFGFDEEVGVLTLTVGGTTDNEAYLLGTMTSRDDELCATLPVNGRNAAQESAWAGGDCELASAAFGGILGVEGLNDELEDYWGGDVLTGTGVAYGGVGTGGIGGLGLGGYVRGGGGFGTVTAPSVEVTLDSLEVSDGFEDSGRSMVDEAIEYLDYCWNESEELTGSFSVTFDVGSYGLVDSVEVTGLDDNVVILCVEYEFLSIWHDTAQDFAVTINASFAVPEAEASP